MSNFVVVYVVLKSLRFLDWGSAKNMKTGKSSFIHIRYMLCLHTIFHLFLCSSHFVSYPYSVATRGFALPLKIAHHREYFPWILTLLSVAM